MVYPFFSVVIPTHNRASLLRRAVDSVLCQTYDNFELIIVDDHSTDETMQVAKSYSDSRVKYILNKGTKGACGARNTGIFTAKGKWTAFLDDDDVWHSDKLKFQFKKISVSKSSVGLICSDYMIYKGKGKKPQYIKNRPTGWVENKILYGGLIGCLSSTCVRTEKLIKINGFDELFPASQDQDLWIRLSGIVEFTFVPKVLVFMYQEERIRIGINHKNKLIGTIMLRNKFKNKVNSDIRLKCRFESNIFMYSLLLKKRKYFKESLFWFLISVVCDFPYSFLNIRKAAILFFKFRNNIVSINWS